MVVNKQINTDPEREEEINKGRRKGTESQDTAGGVEETRLLGSEVGKTKMGSLGISYPDSHMPCCPVLPALGIWPGWGQK